jgi:inosine/xanthosine triphosphatase
MKVYVASLRPAKVEAVRDALHAIAAVDARFRGAELEAVDVGAAAPRMPMSGAEILAGARARALTLAGAPRPAAGERFFVGVEGGLDPVPLAEGGTIYALANWACVTDGARVGLGAGGHVLVPDAIARAVAAGRELGDVVDALAGAPVRGTRGAWGLLTRDLIGRRDAFRVAVVAAFAPFYNARMYVPDA